LADEVRLLGAFLLALILALLATPIAIGVARRTGFMDKPMGYKAHGRATPYLGGLAVISSVIATSLLLAPEIDETLLWIAGGGACISAVGTLDDKVALHPWLRLVIVGAAATALFVGDHGWELFGSVPLDLALTILWMAAVVNAFNLMDNMDGATATVTAVAGAAIGIAAAIEDVLVVAVAALAVSGACLGFLRYNLAAPARIFLGDGGSMAIGFIVGASLMALSGRGGVESTVFFLAAVPLVGLPALDTALVMISRRRRGIPLWTGGRDHVTHRLFGRLRSSRSVALVLACGQAALCGLGLALMHASEAVAVAAAAGYAVLAVLAIVRLESPPFGVDAQPPQSA
jgi:UDP-GlcNAc:undecaprenyl-phosphate GlcNAc-1-phosphate transferase